MLRRLAERWQATLAGVLIVAGLAGGVWRMEDTRHDADEKISEESAERARQACDDLIDNRQVIREILDFALGPPSPDDSPREAEFREFVDSVLEVPPRCAD